MAAPELHPIPVVSSWYHVGIDFIGPLQPPSTQGSRYILTISNYFTKYVLAIPTETKHASGVVDALFKVLSIIHKMHNELSYSLFRALPELAAYCDTFVILQIFMRFGLPKVLTSDQGSEFNNSLDTLLMEMLGIDHWLTTPYHPWVCHGVHMLDRWDNYVIGQWLSGDVQSDPTRNACQIH